MDITIYAKGVDDISSAGPDSIQVSLEEVDLGQIVSEVGLYEILEEVGDDNIHEYLKEKEETEETYE